ncbi:hypothetical protein [Massilia sp. CCM 8734]|uniref:hypothetical protein n=1 Tax=Massilia sp. CCM 8734 TaxID=2609283 RepID=UPI00142093BF|nr:hypothetical protein [Massilia sp. CCM 8734]
MWWSAIVALALSGAAGMTRQAPVRILLIAFSLPFFWIWRRLWLEKKEADDDADARQLGRLIGADYDKLPAAGFLDQFTDNPWQGWPKFAGDIEVGRVLRATGETPAFFIVDVCFNKKNRDEDLAAYTVTFVVIPLRTARPGRLEESMIPKHYKALEGTAFLYFYRAKRWTEAGEGAHLSVDDVPEALAHAGKLAVQLGHAGHGL